MIETQFITNDYKQAEIEEIEKELNMFKSAIKVGLLQNWSTIHNEAKNDITLNRLMIAQAVWCKTPKIKDDNFMSIAQRGMQVFIEGANFVIYYRFSLGRRIAYQVIKVSFNIEKFINTKEYYDVIEEGEYDEKI